MAFVQSILTTNSPFFSDVLPGPVTISSTLAVRVPLGPAILTVAPAAIMPTAINWAEPAKTIEDNPTVVAIERPLLIDKVPKIIPKGMAPTISGTMSRAPAHNSADAEGCLMMHLCRKKL